MALESYGTVANFGMNLRAAIPRTPIDNNRGNATATENLRDFQQLQLRGRTVANAIGALAALKALGGSLGSPVQDLRGRSFGFFALGLATGETALLYDSVAVVLPTMSPKEIPPLSSYQDAMTAALAQLDTALVLANAARTATGANGFPLPNDWLRTTTATSLDDYVRLLHSVKARFRAGVARNPTERAAVVWSAVLADAQAGIAKDVVLDLNNGAGWGNAWLNQYAVFQGWSNIPNYIIGMADTSSGYANWIATDRAARTPFLIVSPDARFPQGNDRATQTASSPAATAILPSVYFRNRTAGEDTPGDPWGLSYYDYARFRSYRQNSQASPWVWMSRVESDMLAAEALIRLGRPAEAVAYVNRTRTINGLPPFLAGATAADRAPAQPGGSASSCVPRTPTGPGGALECGTLMEAVKYEKRMETIFTGYAQWLIDSRGWGDLVVGTPQMWPVPFQEMDARYEPFYNSLVGDPKWVAQTSTYNFGVGAR
jgi:hypothetical protein